MILDRPNSSRVRKPQFLCIVGCEGKNQERMYLEKIAQLVNCVEERSRDLVFDFAEPYYYKYKKNVHEHEKEGG